MYSTVGMSMSGTVYYHWHIMQFRMESIWGPYVGMTSVSEFAVVLSSYKGEGVGLAGKGIRGVCYEGWRILQTRG